jgi:N-ethylmaleimide reductase
MTIEDIKQTVLDFKNGQKTIAAGFDGVELRPCGQLLHQFFLMGIPTIDLILMVDQ